MPRTRQSQDTERDYGRRSRHNAAQTWDRLDDEDERPFARNARDYDEEEDYDDEDGEQEGRYFAGYDEDEDEEDFAPSGGRYYAGGERGFSERGYRSSQYSRDGGNSSVPRSNYERFRGQDDYGRGERRPRRFDNGEGNWTGGRGAGSYNREGDYERGGRSSRSPNREGGWGGRRNFENYGEGEYDADGRVSQPYPGYGRSDSDYAEPRYRGGQRRGSDHDSGWDRDRSEREAREGHRGGRRVSTSNLRDYDPDYERLVSRRDDSRRRGGNGESRQGNGGSRIRSNSAAAASLTSGKGSGSSSGRRQGSRSSSLTNSGSNKSAKGKAGKTRGRNKRSRQTASSNP